MYESRIYEPTNTCEEENAKSQTRLEYIAK